METSNNFVCESSELTHGYRLKIIITNAATVRSHLLRMKSIPQDGHFFTAEAMIRQHVAQVHHGRLQR